MEDLYSFISDIKVFHRFSGIGIFSFISSISLFILLFIFISLFTYSIPTIYNRFVVYGDEGNSGVIVTVMSRCQRESDFEYSVMLTGNIVKMFNDTADDSKDGDDGMVTMMPM